jgi:hypothetical protein
VRDNKIFLYINWTKSFSLLNRAFREKLKWTRGNPTHDLQFVRDLAIGSQLNGADGAIIFCQNEDTRRSLWEVGYMLENIFLQAKSLDISYESKVFSADTVSQLNELEVANAVAAVFL